MTLRHVVLLSVVISLLFGAAVVPALALLSNNQQAPDFQLSDLSGNTHKLSSYHGRVVVIDFFGAHCSYCKNDAMASLIPLYNLNYKDDTHVQFLSVEVTGADVATIQASYLEGMSIPWPVLIDGKNLVKSYDFSDVPTIYVIDSAGKVALTMEYPTNAQTLQATIDKLEAAITTPTPSASPSTQPPAKLNESATSVAKVSPTSPATSRPISERANSTQPAVSGGIHTPANDTHATTNANGTVVTSMEITAAPLNPSASTATAGQPSSVGSSDVASLSQETPARAASPAPMATDTPDITMQYVDALTGQASNGANLPPQPALELSILALGLPAIVIGIICLMMRKF